MGHVRKLQEQLLDDFSSGKIKLLSKKSKIRFQCQQSGKCCHHNEVMLNPYDIMEAAKYLKISSVDFLDKYCTVHIGDSSHLPIAMLKQIQTGQCAFLKKGICSIHPAKPKICRAFPLAAASIWNQKTGKRKQGYVNSAKHQSCPGTKANHTVTFEQFSKQADLPRYDKGSRPFLGGMQNFCMTYRTDLLTENDHQILIALIYFPDSMLKQKHGDDPKDSGEWCKIGMEFAEKYLQSKNIRRTEPKHQN
jgi:Fe-S-cluster containining protein